MKIKAVLERDWNSIISTGFGDIEFNENGVAEISDEAGEALSKLKHFEVVEQEAPVVEKMKFGAKNSNKDNDKGAIPKTDEKPVAPVVVEEKIVEEPIIVNESESGPLSKDQIEKMSDADFIEVLTAVGYSEEEVNKMTREEKVNLIS